MAHPRLRPRSPIIGPAPATHRLLVALVALLFAATARASEPTAADPSRWSGPGGAQQRIVRVELLTMSRAEELYARFGHAAFRVIEIDRGRGRGNDRVYNYGYTRFDEQLAWHFLRGEARFWVALAAMRSTVQHYLDEGRSIVAHPLRLTDTEHQQLAEMLRVNRLPQNRYYTYHHYHDNCATRLRDAIDRVLGGALRRRWRGDPPASPTTFRQLTREGFAGRLAILLALELVLGRAVDRPIDRWQAAFLPRLLAEQLRQVQLKGRGALLGPPATILEHQGADPVGGDPLAAVKLLWALAALLAALAAAALVGIARRRRWAGLCLVPQALVVGLAGALIGVLALVSVLPELRGNELLVLLWPTDLALLWPAVRLVRRRFYAGRLLRGYCLVRAAAATLAVAAHLVGLLYQQPRAWLAMVWIPSVLLWVAVRRLPPGLGRAGGEVDVDRQPLASDG